MKRLKQILVTLCVMCLFITSTIGVYAMEYVEITEIDEYYDSTKYPDSTDSTHTEFMYTGYTDTTNEKRVYSTFEGNSEIVSFVYSGVSGGALGFASLEPFTLTTLKTYPKYPHKGDSGWAQYEDEISTHESFYVEDTGIYVIINTSSDLNTYWYGTGDIYVNTTTVLSVPTKVGYTNVKNYLETGDKSCVVKDGLPSYNADELKLDSIDLRFFDSNDYDNCYYELYYQLPEGIEELGLHTTYRYSFSGSRVGGLLGEQTKTHSSTTSEIINSNQNYGQYYIKNINAVNDLVDYGSMSGLYDFLGPIDPGFQVTKRDIMGLSSDIVLDTGIFHVNISKLYIDIDVVQGGVFGERYSFEIDFISGNTTSYVSTPDNMGSYENSDYAVNPERYFTEVSQDNFGNTTYNYYIIDSSDNSKTEITEYPEYDYNPDDDTGTEDTGTSTTITNEGGNIVNTNTNNPTFNNNVNVTVEGDTINNDVEQEVDQEVTEEDTKGFVNKFLSLFKFLENNAFMDIYAILFGWLPAEVQAVITSAIGISTGVGLFRFFRK